MRIAVGQEQDKLSALKAPKGCDMFYNENAHKRDTTFAGQAVHSKNWYAY